MICEWFSARHRLHFRIGRAHPEPRVVEWLEYTDEAALYLSVLTLGEIRKGVAALPQSKRRTRLETWLEVDLRARFSDRIFPVDAIVADRWGLLPLKSNARACRLLLLTDCWRRQLFTTTYGGFRNDTDFLSAEVPVLILGAHDLISLPLGL